MWTCVFLGVLVANVLCGVAWNLGISACARRHHCIVKQSTDAKDWTGELTKKMQAKLAKRERHRAGDGDE